MANERELEAEIDRLNQEIVRLNHLLQENLGVIEAQEKELTAYHACYKQLQNLLVSLGKTP